MHTVTFTLADDFCWDTYVRDVHEHIVCASRPIHVIWDLTGMTRLPPMSVVIKQAQLMRTERDAVRRNIATNTVILHSASLKSTLAWVFNNIYAPQSPTKMFTFEEWKALG